MKNLLIISHAPSENTAKLTNTLFSAAQQDDTQTVSTSMLSPLDTNLKNLLAADGVIFFTTENFGYMSGAVKDLFDRTYYGLLDCKRGTPFAIIIRAGKDGSGAKRSMHSILQGLGWREVCDTVILRGEFKNAFYDDVKNLGQTMAAGMAVGIF